jgi:hypothetical protein
MITVVHTEVSYSSVQASIVSVSDDLVLIHHFELDVSRLTYIWNSD